MKFNIFHKIQATEGGISVVSTKRLIKFIEKYGVNYVSLEEKLLTYWDYFTRDQIDLIFSHKPDFFDPEGNLMYVGSTSKTSLHMIRKMLEYDRDYSFCTRKIAVDVFYGRWKVQKHLYINYIREFIIIHHSLQTKYTYKIIQLLENHDKRRRTFFMDMWDRFKSQIN